ncbi:hypothetical protein [Staphylococcus kloosii]|jgi:hypothetical protein|uniref:hypothetical protein n=1 Tax=Staphylococcus kloosii TaxID=29384 RepID=UPI00189F978D|nr:hypothetical protein [Staphylococcus kloosii]MBF7030008.1 hypothetical protein [Staphylococcus kloosii]
MREIISFFTLFFTSFKFLKKYFDFTKLDYYAPLLFNFVITFILGSAIFGADMFLGEKVVKQNALWDIYLITNGTVLFLLVIIYVATYSTSLNHFILYADHNNFIFERKSLVSAFTKDFLKVSSEKNLVESHNREEKVYQFMYNYQIENIEYIDRESNLYNEFICQQQKGIHKRLFRCNIKIRWYFWILIGIFFITTLFTSFFLDLYLLLVVTIITHTLIYILSIVFFAKINFKLHRENDKDKVKLMRYTRSLKKNHF